MVGVITSAPTPQGPTSAPVMMGISCLDLISVRVRVILVYMFMFTGVYDNKQEIKYQINTSTISILTMVVLVL